MTHELVVMGYAAPEARTKTRQRMTELAARLGELAGMDVAITPLPSYDRVAQLIHHRDIDFAWMSPIPLVSLARNRRVVPLVSFRRAARSQYACALLVSTASHTSAFEELRGKRAAWVDRHSASGYVLPRIELATRGIDRDNLASERFFGSHDGVVRAIASGRADFGATFARVGRNGGLTGPWSHTPLARSVRVMTTFGDVPPDAIAARFDLAPEVRERFVGALRAMARDVQDRGLLGDVFGAEDFDRPRRASYEALRTAVFDAYTSGVLATDAASDAILDVAATIEHRIPPEPPTARRLEPSPRDRPSGASSDETQEEVEVLEVIEAAERMR